MLFPWVEAAAALDDHVVQLYFNLIIRCNRHALFCVRQVILQKTSFQVEHKVDLLAKLRFTNIPSWSKYLLFSMLVIIGLVNSMVFFVGLTSLRDTWVQASIQFLSVFLPVFTIVYVALHIQSGEAALLNSIKRIYLKTLPLALAQIDEAGAPFYPTGGKVRKKKAAKSNITIETNYLAGQIDADFLIHLTPSRLLIIRLEINFRRINFNLYLTRDQVEKILGRTDLAVQEITAKDSTRWVLERIGHSVGGASFSEAKRIAIGDQDVNYQSGYVFNDQMIQRELAGQQYYCLVAMKTVSQQFIWEVAERVYFCFDLMLMLRAMLDECPELAMDSAIQSGATATLGPVRGDAGSVPADARQ
jgi:hypothetical protein